MVCPNCGSENVTISMEQVSSKTKKHGNGIGGHINNAARGLMAVSTLGMSNLVWKKSKGGEKTNEEQHDPPCAIAAPTEAVTVSGVGRSHRHSQHGAVRGKRHSITPFEKIFISNRGHDFDYLKSP